MKADTIYKNGRFYTENKEAPWADAVAIEGKKLIAVGSEEDCSAFADEGTKVVDLGGRVVLPGLIDGHTHPITVARTHWRVRMPLTHDREELLANIRQAAADHPKEECPYLYCENYFAETFGDAGPTRQLLDEIVSDRPARIQDFTDHACWFNSAALDLLKDENGEIRIETSAIQPEFKKDENGEYTGWVQEPFDDIDEVIYEKIGWYPPQEITDDMVDPLLDYFKAHGITCMMDALTTGEDSMEYFYQKDRKGELGMYYDATSILTAPDKIDEAIATARDWQEKYGGEHIRCNTIKFFIDGTNELGDCLSLEPFANDPTGTYCGNSYASEDEMVQVMLKINDAGMDFHVHTICDGAFRLMCNAYERAKAQRPDSWQMYLTLAHCELIDPAEMKRVCDLGIFIDWSTHWSGGYFGEVAREYLGDRWYRMYDFTKIIAGGGIVGYSSDVFTYQEAIRANPFIGMQTAMTRVDMFLPLDPEKYPGSVRPPETAKLPLTDLIRGYTYNNALRMRLLDRMGTIEAGKLANLVVLNRDIFETPAEEIAKVDADLVIYEGQARKISSSLTVERN